jgi:hypothetical protein
MGELQLSGFDMQRIVLVNHPRYAEDAYQCAERLDGWRQEHGLDLLQLESKKGGWEPNAAMLLGNLGEGDVIGMVCGDRTMNDIATGLIRVPELAKRGVAITHTNRGGQAGDAGRALHGRFMRDPRIIFGESRTVDAYGLQSTVTYNGETHQDIAISYMALGESAIGAGRVNGKEYREGIPVFRELSIMLGILGSANSFGIRDEKGERRFRSLEISKGSAIAKLGIVPVHPWENKMHINEVAATTYATYRAAAGLLIGKGGGEPRKTPYSCEILDYTFMHVDGDVVHMLEPGSTCTVEVAQQSYKLLARRASARNTTRTRGGQSPTIMDAIEADFRRQG